MEIYSGVWQIEMLQAINLHIQKIILDVQDLHMIKMVTHMEQHWEEKAEITMQIIIVSL